MRFDLHLEYKWEVGVTFHLNFSNLQDVEIMLLLYQMCHHFLIGRLSKWLSLAAQKEVYLF